MNSCYVLRNSRAMVFTGRGLQECHRRAIVLMTLLVFGGVLGKFLEKATRDRCLCPLTGGELVDFVGTTQDAGRGVRRRVCAPLSVKKKLSDFSVFISIDVMCALFQFQIYNRGNLWKLSALLCFWWQA